MTRQVELLRAVIMVESIRGDQRRADGSWVFRLASHPRIGYVRITTFANKTVDELDEVMAALTSSDIDGVLIDLRNNSGGSLDTGIAVSDMFLPAGLTIVSTKERDRTVLDHQVSTGSGPYPSVPLVLIIDQNTASASEIVAACLQDHGRAVVAGERSFGKGTVQRLVPTEAGRSILKLTSASFWRPSGKNIHRSGNDAADNDWGVTPNEHLSYPLTTEERRAYYRYRAWQDRLMPAATRDAMTHDAMAEFTDSAEAETAADYDDRVLQAAVAYLEALSE